MHNAGDNKQSFLFLLISSMCGGTRSSSWGSGYIPVGYPNGCFLIHLNFILTLPIFVYRLISLIFRWHQGNIQLELVLLLLCHLLYR